MTTLCETSTCPAETPAQELVVLCSGLKPQTSNLVCRFSNGAAVPAQLDGETLHISCKAPQVWSYPSACPGRPRTAAVVGLVLPNAGSNRPRNVAGAGHPRRAHILQALFRR